MFRHFPNPIDNLSTRFTSSARPVRLGGSVNRSGLTMIELLVASAIMVLIVGALAFLAKAVQVGAEYGGGHGEAIQNARVVLERITHMANEATTSQSFPGMLVVPHTDDGVEIPDTLVVWHPDGDAIDPEGLPRYNEIVIYCPNADRPNELIELTAPGDTRTVPAYSDQSGWQTTIEALKASDTTRQIVMTDLLRTASVDDTAPSDTKVSCVRFKLRLRPSEQQIAEFEAGTTPWNELPWIQNIYSDSLGLRQVWLRIELQLVPGQRARNNTQKSLTAIPFFDSATVHYTIKNNT